MGVLALSTAATLALVAGIVVSVAFVGALVALAIRRRGLARRTSPGMKPGPSDDILERRQQGVMGMGNPLHPPLRGVALVPVAG